MGNTQIKAKQLGPNSVGTSELINNEVTLGKIQQVAAKTLLGNFSGSGANVGVQVMSQLVYALLTSSSGIAAFFASMGVEFGIGTLDASSGQTPVQVVPSTVVWSATDYHVFLSHSGQKGVTKTGVLMSDPTANDASGFYVRSTLANDTGAQFFWLIFKFQ